MFFYVATPYALYPDGKDAAYNAAIDMHVKLLEKNWPVFVPIVYMHNTAKRLQKEPAWLEKNLPFMQSATLGCLVIKLLSWEHSIGIKEEIEWFTAQKRDVLYLDPNEEIPYYDRLFSVKKITTNMDFIEQSKDA